MGKRGTKSEKLDLILSELTKLRRDVKKLVRDRAIAADHGAKAKRRSAPGQPKKPQPPGAGTKPDRDATPSKPVLVQAPRVPQPSSRTQSQ